MVASKTYSKKSTKTNTKRNFAVVGSVVDEQLESSKATHPARPAMRTAHPWETIIVATTRLSYGPRRTCADHRLRGGRPRSRTLISPLPARSAFG